MIIHLIFVTAFLASTVGRQMCYTCQYTITSTKQGIECASQFNDTIAIQKCPDKCIIHSETNLETEELRSYFRGCDKGYSKNVCSKNGNIETCYYTCTDNFCNGIDIRPTKNNSPNVTIDQTMFLFFVFLHLSEGTKHLNFLFSNIYKLKRILYLGIGSENCTSIN